MKIFRVPVSAPLVVPLLTLAAFGTGCAASRIGRSVDTRTRPRPGIPIEIADVRTGGPFYERVETSGGDTRASLRPLIYTRIESPGDDAGVREVLWPLSSLYWRKEHLSWRVATIFGRDADTTDPDSAYHVWAFPIWFHGRNKQGENYAALFPLGGTLRDFMMYDKMSFALFPLWLETERVGIKSRNILWPVFGRATGDGFSSWRVFPLAGYKHKEGDVRQHFALWPIWSYATYFREGQEGYEWALVPIFGRGKRTNESSTYILPPFFQFTHGHGPNAGERRILAPWPLVRIEDSRLGHKRQFWPLYVRNWTDTSISKHIAWPFYNYTYQSYGRTDEEAWSFAPFFHRSVLRQAAGEHEIISSYTRVWPFWSRINNEDRRFVRVPDFSFQRRTGALERNLLHMFTLYTRGEQAHPRRHEHEVLWGFLRWGSGEDGYRTLRIWPFFNLKRDPELDESSWSVLGGLAGKEKRSKGKSWRIFWFKRTATNGDPPSEESH